MSAQQAEESTTAKMWKLLIVAVIGSTLFGAGTGWLATSAVFQARDDVLNEQRQDYIAGVAQGAQYALEYRQWKEADKPPNDLRADPNYRCASKFYHQKAALVGCIEGANGPPEEGYSWPR